MSKPHTPLKEPSTAAMFSSNNQEWETPQALFDELDAEFHFTLDPCCSHENAKCDKHYTKEEDGLAQDWTGETVFCNPPYTRKFMPMWIKKCAEHAEHGGTAVMLIPARTDTKAFHEYIYHKAEIRFLKGRIRFSDAWEAPFPSMIVVFKGKDALRGGEQGGLYECFHCLSRSVVWDCDYDFEDFGYEGEGIVQMCHCENCGAEIEYRILLNAMEETDSG